MPVINCYLAFDDRFFMININLNWKIRELKNVIKDQLKNFIVGAKEIEFVKYNNCVYPELGNQIVDELDEMILFDYLEGQESFYIRPIYRIKNERYLKSTFNIIINNNIEYKFAKYEDLEKLKRGNIDISELNIVSRSEIISSGEGNEININNELNNNCIICYERFLNDDEKINRYQCNHNNICNSCYLNWHLMNKLTCPMCRSNEI